MARWLVSFGGEIEVEAESSDMARIEAERKFDASTHASAECLDPMCEGCEEVPAVTTDSEGVQLCQSCYDDCVAEAEAENEEEDEDQA